ncbi:aldose epimerase family protein [Dokdonia sp.]|uniref:aldose epimerase family protein n=1 Tax=Dokdonia sp. TaxID=2024995 RepID=UPI003265D1A5
MPILKTITLHNTHGLRLEICNYGATITALYIPNKQKGETNVIVGLDTAQAYTTTPYTDYGICLGASIGRYAGRISDSKKETLLTNDEFTYTDGVHLHGGTHGFDQKYWNIEEQEDHTTVTLSYLSVHMEEGYPGNLKVVVTYTLTEDNEVVITYTATTDATTYLNLTNHAYFNLDGERNVLDHTLRISSDQYLEVLPNLIPTGTLKETAYTRFDRKEVSQIGRPDFLGYDDTFVLNDHPIKASLFSAKTGIHMDVYTNQPGMVVYTPKQLPEIPYKEQAIYGPFSAICFETQNFPDAPHHPHFPSALLHPEETYSNESRFVFTLIG